MGLCTLVDHMRGNLRPLTRSLYKNIYRQLDTTKSHPRYPYSSPHPDFGDGARCLRTFLEPPDATSHLRFLLLFLVGDGVASGMDKMAGRAGGVSIGVDGSAPSI